MITIHTYLSHVDMKTEFLLSVLHEETVQSKFIFFETADLHMVAKKLKLLDGIKYFKIYASSLEQDKWHDISGWQQTDLLTESYIQKTIAEKKQRVEEF